MLRRGLVIYIYDNVSQNECLCEVDGEDPTCKFGGNGLSNGFVGGCDDADEAVELPVRSVWGEVFGLGLRGHIEGVCCLEGDTTTQSVNDPPG
jgi:hypothetical protein